MLEFNERSNTLEQSAYKYTLQDVKKPNLYRHLYNYDEVPKIPFNHRHVPMRPEGDLDYRHDFSGWAASARTFTVEQIVHLYKLLHKLGGPKGVSASPNSSSTVRRIKKRLNAVWTCSRISQITSWIRAVKEDFQLVKNMGIKETGILASASDYHIFNKLKMTRKQAMEQYLSIVKSALEIGIIPGSPGRYHTG